MDSHNKVHLKKLLSEFSQKVIDLFDGNQEETSCSMHQLSGDERATLDVFESALTRIANLSETSDVSVAIAVARKALDQSKITLQPWEVLKMSMRADEYDNGDVFATCRTPSTPECSSSPIPEFSVANTLPSMPPENCTEASRHPTVPAQDSLETTDDATDPPQSKKTKKSTLNYPCPLPDLTPRLECAYQKNELAAHRKDFIKLHVRYFVEQVSEPTKRDYEVYSRTIVDKYDVFKDSWGNDKQCWKAFHSKFTEACHNRRMYLRAAPVRRRKATARYLQRKEPSSHRDPDAGTVDEESSFEEVEKQLSSGKWNDTKTWKDLLSKHHQQRRRTISAISSIPDRAAAFPYFRNLHAVLAEFELMTQAYSTFEAKFNSFVLSVERLCEVTSEDAERFFDCLTQRVVHPRLKKLEYPCILRKEVGQEILENFDQSCSPFVVVYYEGDSLSTFSVMAFGQIFLQSEAVSLWQAVAALLAVYYVYDIEYPKAYVALQLVDDHCIATRSAAKVVEGFCQSSRYQKLTSEIAKRMTTHAS